jgi:monovalent cation:H+ antiporter, CPA1 family
MAANFQTAILLLLVAAVVAMVSKRLRVPYAVGLVAAGIVLAAVPFAPRIVLTKDLIYTALLPPLLFEAAYHIDWGRLRRNAPLVAVLATLGVALFGAVAATGMHYLAGWPWGSALIFGALISATDPVSVIATFREARASGRLLLLMESESLLNDGMAAVAFAVVVALATGQQIGAGGTVLLVLKEIGGGFACGALVGAVALLLTGHTDDHLVEITCTTVAAYGSFLLADGFGMSGVLATIAAGLVMRNATRIDDISPRGRDAIENFWEYAAFIANSMVFLLIGAQHRNHDFAAEWWSILIAVAVVLAGRAAAVYFCSALFARSRLRVTAKHQHAMFWGGLHGALAMALALGLPAEIPLRNEIVTVSFAVVAFSIFVQGLTMPVLLRKIGEIPKNIVLRGPEAEKAHAPESTSAHH